MIWLRTMLLILAVRWMRRVTLIAIGWTSHRWVASWLRGICLTIGVLRCCGILLSRRIWSVRSTGSRTTITLVSSRLSKLGIVLLVRLLIRPLRSSVSSHYMRRNSIPCDDRGTLGNWIPSNYNARSLSIRRLSMMERTSIVGTMLSLPWMGGSGRTCCG